MLLLSLLLFVSIRLVSIAITERARQASVFRHYLRVRVCVCVSDVSDIEDVIN